jgi:hypothetical protein
MNSALVLPQTLGDVGESHLLHHLETNPITILVTLCQLLFLFGLILRRGRGWLPHPHIPFKSEMLHIQRLLGIFFSDFDQLKMIEYLIVKTLWQSCRWILVLLSDIVEFVFA